MVRAVNDGVALNSVRREMVFLTRRAEEARAEALEEAAKACDREANACHHHAKAISKTHPKGRVSLARAHDMAGIQSSACAHYIRALFLRPARGECAGH